MSGVTSDEWSLAICWSVVALLMFGFSNYLTGYTNTLGIDFYASLSLIFFGSAIYPLLSLPSILVKHGTMFFPAQDCSENNLNENPQAPTSGSSVGLMNVPGSANSGLQNRVPNTGATVSDYFRFSGLDDSDVISRWTKFATLCGGVLVGMAQVFVKMAIGADPVDAGPLCAIVSSDVVLVGLFCHFVYGEKMSFTQSFAVFGVFIGIVTMAMGDGNSDQNENSAAVIVDSYGGSGVLLAIFWAICASLSFGSSVLAIRIGAIGGLAPQSAFTARMLAMGCLGLVFLFYSIFTGELQSTMLPFHKKMGDWLLCVFTGLLQAVGVYGVNKALAYPMTGVCIAIFGSFSIVVLICSAIEQQVFPNTQKLVGMAISMASCASVGLLAPTNAVEDEDEEDTAQGA